MASTLLLLQSPNSHAAAFTNESSCSQCSHLVELVESLAGVRSRSTGQKGQRVQGSAWALDPLRKEVLRLLSYAEEDASPL